MIHLLDKYFKHDDTIEDIVLSFNSKKIGFLISNYIENIEDYKYTEIEFHEVRCLYFNHMFFIDDSANLELDILTFDKKEIANDLYEFSLILDPGFGAQDVMISFVCNINNIQVKNLGCR